MCNGYRLQLKLTIDRAERDLIEKHRLLGLSDLEYDMVPLTVVHGGGGNERWFSESPGNETAAQLPVDPHVESRLALRAFLVLKTQQNAVPTGPEP